MNDIKPNSIFLTPAIDSTLSYQLTSNSTTMNINDIRIATTLRVGGQIIGKVDTLFHDLIHQQVQYAKYRPEYKQQTIALLEKMIEDMLGELDTIKTIA